MVPVNFNLPSEAAVSATISALVGCVVISQEHLAGPLGFDQDAARSVSFLSVLCSQIAADLRSDP